jgi:hypothetical protein
LVFTLQLAVVKNNEKNVACKGIQQPSSNCRRHEAVGLLLHHYQVKAPGKSDAIAWVRGNFRMDAMILPPGCWNRSAWVAVILPPGCSEHIFRVRLFGFVFRKAVRTKTVGVPLHDPDHILFQHLHLLAPAVIVSVAGKLPAAFRTYFCGHLYLFL